MNGIKTIQFEKYKFIIMLKVILEYACIFVAVKVFARRLLHFRIIYKYSLRVKIKLTFLKHYDLKDLESLISF
jgi:hypothetical protein